MPSQSYIVRSHIRTIYTRPITFICAKCEQLVTRECYPGKRPIYCLKCSPPKKSNSDKTIRERGAFNPTHYLVNPKGEKKTEVCLEKCPQPGWFWVRSPLDWFSGESIIRYHKEKGLYSHQEQLSGFSLEALSPEETNSPKLPKSKEESDEADVVMTAKEAIAATLYVASRPYSGREICQRFHCGDRLLTNMRSSPDFTEWSKTRDPQGIPWEYIDGQYFPLSPIEQKIEPYSGRQICKRFHCGDRLLKNIRSSPEFSKWSQERDPQGIAWEYRNDKYYPIVDDD